MKIEYFIIIGLMVWILFLSMCSEPNIETEKVIFHTRDSITITQTDTFIVQKHHYHIQPGRTDTVYFTKEYVATLDTFQFFINDSILEATITALSDTQPIINLDYRVKYFKMMTNTIIKDSTVVLKENNALFFGALVGGKKDRFAFVPKIDYHTKKGFIYSGGYDLINKDIYFGISKKIRFRK